MEEKEETLAEAFDEFTRMSVPVSVPRNDPRLFVLLKAAFYGGAVAALCLRRDESRDKWLRQFKEYIDS